MVTEQSALSFAGLLRRLRAGAKLTQEELAAAAGVSPRSVSNLERGVNRTAHKDTAVLLAGALGLTGTAAKLFVAAARGNVPAAQVLAAADGARPRPGAVTGSPYRGLAAFGEQDAEFFFGREAATAQVLDRMSRTGARAGGRRERRGEAVCGFLRPGAAGSWRCGWHRWRVRTRPAVRREAGTDPDWLRSRPGKPPWRVNLARGCRPAARCSQRRVLVSTSSRPVHPGADEAAAAFTALHAPPPPGTGQIAPAAVLGRADFEARARLPAAGRCGQTGTWYRDDRAAAADGHQNQPKKALHVDETCGPAGRGAHQQPGTFGAVLPPRTPDQSLAQPGRAGVTLADMNAPAASKAPSPPRPACPRRLTRPAGGGPAGVPAADRHQQRGVDTLTAPPGRS
jgi:transcriptional regulator with XRE-family HTH domain